MHETESPYDETLCCSNVEWKSPDRGDMACKATQMEALQKKQLLKLRLSSGSCPADSNRTEDGSNQETYDFVPVEAYILLQGLPRAGHPGGRPQHPSEPEACWF